MQKLVEIKIGVSHEKEQKIRKIKKEPMVIKMSNVSTFLSHHQGGKKWVLSHERSTSKWWSRGVKIRSKIYFLFLWKCSSCIKGTVGIRRRVVQINLSDLTVASSQYDILLCSETLVSDMRHVSEVLVPGFCRLVLLCRGKMPRARGMAAYVRDGCRAFRQPKF